MPSTTRRRNLLAVLMIVLAAWPWRSGRVVVDIPKHWKPWTPLDVSAAPNGWTRYKLSQLDNDVDACRAALASTSLRYSALPDRVTGAGCGYRNAVRIDSYKVTHLLLRNLAKRGARIFDRSAMAGFDVLRDHLSLRMESGARVRCQRLVIASGYESQQYLPRKVAKIRSSYALVTEPLESLPMQLADTLIWERARPYVYLRSTADKRILIGGEDDRIDVAAKRDAAVPWKAEKLMRQLKE